VNQPMLRYLSRTHPIATIRLLGGSSARFLGERSFPIPDDLELREPDTRRLPNESGRGIRVRQPLEHFKHSSRATSRKDEAARTVRLLEEVNPTK
jgi:hypothetical protein